jgi:hypothetical protein
MLRISARRAAAAVACAALLYSVVHFVQSGIRFPLSSPNLGQVEEQVRPLLIHLQDGRAITTNNPRQYGPTFLVVMQPILRWAGDDWVRLSRALYALALTLYAASFALTVRTLWPLMAPPRRRWTIIGLLVLWLNFAPAYAILAVKNVEIWELFLLCLAVDALARQREWLAGIAVGLAGFTKVLPLFFGLYLLLRHRRALVFALAGAFAISVVSHAMYGPEVGLFYIPRMLQSSATTQTSLWHENISIKGMTVKAFGHLEGASDPRYAELAHGGSGHAVVIEPARLAIAQTLAWALQIAGAAWLIWMIWRRGGADSSVDRIGWEWALFTAMMLILSPSTAFEYTTLALGAFSYALVKLVSDPRRYRPVAWAAFAAAVFLIANIIPRSAVARLLFIEQINRITMYGQLSPTEGFQYYGFPLLGLILLVVSVVSVEPASADA